MDRRGRASLTPRWRSFDEALKLRPADKDLQLDYARVALDAEKLTRAQELAAEAVRSDPGDAQARFLLGRVLFHLQELQGSSRATGGGSYCQSGLQIPGICWGAPILFCMRRSWREHYLTR